MRIAAGQMAAGNDIEANLRAIDLLARRASVDGARLLVLPEYSTYAKKDVDGSFLEVAEPLDGPVCTGLGRIAAKNSLAMVAGVVETGDSPSRVFNTLVTFDAAGSLIAFYRKIHLFDAQGHAESEFVQPAPTPKPVAFTLDGLSFGLQTCYDLRFAEHSRALADAGSDILLVCAAWVPGDGKIRQWQVLAAARAIENGCFVVGACQSAPISTGHSTVVDPYGTVLDELGATPDLLVMDLDPARVPAAREHFPVSRQRRL